MAPAAQHSRKKASSGKKRTSTGRQTKGKNTIRTSNEGMITGEIVLIVAFALTILLFLCNFGVIGVVGNAISKVMFGIFGLTAYVAPALIFVAIAFGISNEGNRIALLKLTAGIVLFFLIGIVLELFSGDLSGMESWSAQVLYEAGAQKRGGGVVFGSLAWLLYHFLGMAGCVIFLLVAALICVVIITEKSLVSGIRDGGRRVYETVRTDAMMRSKRHEQWQEEAVARNEERQKEATVSYEQRYKAAIQRREEAAARSLRRREETILKREEKQRRRQEEEARREAEHILRMDKKASGMTTDISLKEPAKKIRDDVHEITVDAFQKERVEVYHVQPLGTPDLDFDKIRIHSAQEQDTQEKSSTEDTVQERMEEAENNPVSQAFFAVEESMGEERERQEETPERIEALPREAPVITESICVRQADVYKDMKEIGLHAEAEEETKTPGSRKGAPLAKEEIPHKEQKVTRIVENVANTKPAHVREQITNPKPYRFPPIDLLQKTTAKSTGDSARQLKETAAKLQQTLQTFGVRVTITDISQGPSVTRYELQPEQGVKVSKILGLSDDIKLNLAATDIRIEAPIPGKAAIGIEVPNKENTAVGLRELLETKEFKDFPSYIAFAVGKDIAGKTVVSDIAKMPHMLIAGATGSGKSVCINTLIMSILYKAKPTDVKLIMIDPKVVELSVYNGIPHLLIPVVTEPKKASAALAWGVAEMEDRYRKFADLNVRDIKGYNKKVEQSGQKDGETQLSPMPQIVIIVDELADLMMVAPGEVESAICRLAQLARAAGIHLIIATQRPSVDVITGLIKANMPSRVAFSVSSGVDSRTILDMNGAEKLLGKGDMLFYPQGYSKPARVQGAFVSDAEVSAVVDFLKNQAIGNTYNQEIEEKIRTIGNSAPGTDREGDTEFDSYFVDAGKFVIEKDKATIGMLQRVFKIGFNRAARIMDQLSELGVVGEEEGTKPRKVLMSLEEFEQLIEETL